jgi:predicted DCC family thiol-disulfide oxidoreductase YuxK
MNRQPDETGASIYYDGDCPFCARYVKLLRLREALGEVRLVDLRRSPDDVTRLRQAGFEPDEGMAFEFGGELHFGQDAVHRLALLGTGSGAFNRFNRWLLGSRHVSRFAYPALRMGRNAVLFLLGRARMREPSPTSQAPWLLFHQALGVFALLHTLVNTFQFNFQVYPSTWLIAALGLGLVLQPASTRLAAALLIAFAVDAWAQLPALSNHTVIKNFLLLAIGACALRQMWRGGDWTAFYRDFAPTGRVLLVVMYVFGVFHKINTDFLDPEVSCAVALWRQMPAFLRWIDFTAFHYAAIYGTLVIETVILACLLLPRTRTVAIGVGIAFHSLLALSAYAMYVPFSTLTIALHLLFIEEESAARILSSPPWRALRGEMERVLHPRWVRAFVHFNPVDLREPKPCALDR